MPQVRQLCGIVAGATGQERVFKVPGPGEKVLITRSTQFDSGWILRNPGTGNLTHGVSRDDEDLIFLQADFGAEDIPNQYNGEAVPSENYEQTYPFWVLDSTFSIYSAGGYGSAGPIAVDITHGDTNHGDNEAPNDYLGNTTEEHDEGASPMWYDWKAVDGETEELLFHMPRVSNSAGMFRWAGIDTTAKLSTVTGASATAYTGSNATYPLISAVRGEHRGHNSAAGSFELAAFHSQFGDEEGAVKFWDLWGNAKDGINVKKVTGRAQVTAGTSTATGKLSVLTYNGGTSREYKFENSGGDLRFTSAGSNSSIDFLSNGKVRFLNTTDHDGSANSTDGSVMFDGGVYIKKNCQVEKDLFVNMTSDERLKKNISTFKNATKMVGKLRGAEFDWKEEANRGFVHDYGVIAQDVEKVLPHAVKEREDGTLAVDYIKLTPLLIEAVKELTERVNELENKNSKTSF